MPESTYTHPLFGLVRFKTATPDRWVRGDRITFLAGFDTSEIRAVTVPQLAAIPGSHAGRLQFHSRAHAQLLMVFSDLDKLGLMKHVKTCAGSLNFRLKKPLSKKPPHNIISKEPSNHAFGIAIDLNADDGSNGATVAPLAPVFEALGFRWGASFNDPMHFEVVRFVDAPKSVVMEVPVAIDGQPSALLALNFAGDLVVDPDTAREALRLNIRAGRAGTMAVSGPSRRQTLQYGTLGERRFVSLAQLAGVAGMTMAYDQPNRTAELTTLA